jgi:dTDP-glucose 4,6-dehydratase
VPVFVTNAIDDLALPIYGDGREVRDWLYVEDHCEGIRTVLHAGTPGEAYNVGGGNEKQNGEVVRSILRLLGKPESLIQHVPDRPGHDRRYSVDSGKLRALGWTPRETFESALEKTVRWYQANEVWWRPIKRGDYLEYWKRNYADRERLTAINV